MVETEISAVYIEVLICQRIYQTGMAQGPG